MLVISSLNVAAWSYVPWVFGFYAGLLMTIIWGFTGHFSAKPLPDTLSDEET